jgi:DNA polymerase/3'-5' exonuclease PolX
LGGNKLANNQEIADKLREIADLLDEQKANPFRVNAYLSAAKTIDSMIEPVEDLLKREGFSALLDIPGIGEGIARSINEYVMTGRMSRLESLQTGHDPIALFEQIPGIGPRSAHRIIETLHIDSLEAFELAAHNGRLKTIPSFSTKKIALVQTWLDRVLGYRKSRPEPQQPIAEPPVGLLMNNTATKRSLASCQPLRLNVLIPTASRGYPFCI